MKIITKLFSLFLCLLMLVGTFVSCDFTWETALTSNVSIEDSLKNYDDVSIFIIYSVEDWNAIAASGKTFAGKKIMIGSDLDFGGKEIPSLIPESLGATMINFDGQGYTVKNGIASASLIAGVLTNIDTDSNLGNDAITDGEAELLEENIIKNITFENIKAKEENSYAILFQKIINPSSVTIENVAVVACEGFLEYSENNDE